jgi:hypothetical protein
VTRTDERLSDLLHAAVPEPRTALDFDAIAVAVRRTGRRRTAGAVTAAAAITAAAVMVPGMLTARPGPHTPTVTASSTASHQQVHRVAYPPMPECEPQQRAGAPPLGKYQVLARLDLRGGYYAFLVGPTGSVVCMKDPRLPLNGSSTQHAPAGTQDWLPGHLSIDHHMNNRGGLNLQTGQMDQSNTKIAQVLAGRVSDQVAKVTATGADGAVASATPVNGVYLVSIYLEHASKAALAIYGGGATVRAYDAHGKLLAETRSSMMAPQLCYLMPDGRKLPRGDKPGASELATCRPALRWSH